MEYAPLLVRVVGYVLSGIWKCLDHHLACLIDGLAVNLFEARIELQQLPAPLAIPPHAPPSERRWRRGSHVGYVPASADGHALACRTRVLRGVASIHRSDTMVFALASRSLRSSSLRPSLAQLAGARRGYAEAVSEKLKLSFVAPHQVR